MKRVASFLAGDVRGNKRLDRRLTDEQQPHRLGSESVDQQPQALGSFGRRMNKRYAADTEFRNQRASYAHMSGGLDGIAELEGDAVPEAYTSIVGGGQLGGSGDESVKRLSMRHGKMVKAAVEPADEQTERRVSTESKFKENIFSPGHKRIDDHKRVDEQLESSLSRLTLDNGFKSRKKRSRKPASPIEPTDALCELMLGIPPKPKQHTVATHRRTKKHQATVTDHSTPPKKDVPNILVTTPSKKGSPNSTRTVIRKLLSPRDRLTLSDAPTGTAGARPMSITIDGARFVFESPPRWAPKGPPPSGPPPTLPFTGVSQPPIPPRVTSRNFSVVQYKEKSGSRLEALPQELRKRILKLVLVAGHEVFICTCSFCSLRDPSMQPAITKASHKLRNEGLPIFYDENRFMIRGTHKWNDKPPAWLRAMSQKSRDMIKHVEIETHDIASVVCMMATIGFQLANRLPRRQHLAVMAGMSLGTMCMTFTAISKVVEEYALPEIKPVSSIHLWDDVQRNKEALRQLDGAGDDDDESISTVGTSILEIGDANEEVIMHGEVARSARKVSRRSMVQEDQEAQWQADEAEEAAVYEDASERGTRYELPTVYEEEISDPKQRFSVGKDLVRAAL